MIIEVNTKLLDVAPDINSNQLLFLSVVLDKNQPTYQDVRKIVSLISDDEISQLIEKKLVTLIEKDDSKTYRATEELKNALKPNQQYFDTFYELYPVYVLRPDGSKCYLRSNVNKCRRMFNVVTGSSAAMAEHIIKCLEYEVSKKMREGKLSYMMTMWNWLTRNQWEVSEEEMRDAENTVTNGYGNELI